MSLLQNFEVSLMIAAMRKNGKIWTMKHEFILPDGTIAATLTIDGGWLDLTKRKVIPPPEEMFKNMDSITKTPDFVWLPDSGTSS
jgi:acyl-CoA thioester hydrolase